MNVIGEIENYEDFKLYLRNILYTQLSSQNNSLYETEIKNEQIR